MSSTEVRKAYASDLAEEQWKVIEPWLPPQNEGGRERQVDLREIINAVNYRTRTGCAWEMLPHDFPPKSTVYEYYRAWQRDGTWQAIHDALRSQVRQQEGRQTDASAAMLDSQSVKTTETRGERGYDAGKKVKGRKRHLLVDTLGLIILVVITAASVQDRDGAKLVFAATEQTRLEKVWADGGYRGELVSWTHANCAWELEIVQRPADQKGFAVLPRRWVVERTFGWFNRYRLLSKEYEATIESSTADIHITMSHLMLRRLAAPPKPQHDNEQRLAHLV
jgi:putative transposase|tara:strand:+ start:669 stop:1505 length:837 start_codon:yes stop_codon:yes gene_type:complete